MLDFLFGADRMGRDVFSVLSDINAKVSSFADKIHLPSLVLYILGVAIAIFLGICGYKFIKLFMSLSFGAIGYCIGTEVVVFINSKMTDYEMLGWVKYVMGGVFALLFLGLAFRKFSYVMFAEITLIGISTGLFYLDGNKVLALGAGLLLALISVYIVRYVFIVISSAVGGFLIVDFLSQVITKADFLKLDTSVAALCIAAALSVVFIVVQLITTRKLVFRRRF